MKKFFKSAKGFTLIELLIVIVIIGILAGVLIAIIDPATQQNRARDAGVQATINKVVLSAQGYISAYGSVPTDLQFLAALSNATDSGTSCDGTDTGADLYDCYFTITGNALPATCSGTAPTATGTGTVQCSFRYFAPCGSTDPDCSQFQIFGKSYGIAETVFRYDNTVGEIQECDDTGTTCT